MRTNFARLFACASDMSLNHHRLPELEDEERELTSATTIKTSSRPNQFLMNIRVYNRVEIHSAATNKKVELMA